MPPALPLTYICRGRLPRRRLLRRGRRLRRDAEASREVEEPGADEDVLLLLEAEVDPAANLQIAFEEADADPEPGLRLVVPVEVQRDGVQADAHRFPHSRQRTERAVAAAGARPAPVAPQEGDRGCEGAGLL